MYIHIFQEFIILLEGQINITKQNMAGLIKGSLVDILFDNTERERISREVMVSKSEEKHKKRESYDFSIAHVQSIKKSNKVIKITQFNSSIVIGEDKLLQKTYANTGAQSPHKNFNIKKIAEFKNKVMANAQKTVQIQLKKKDNSISLYIKPNAGRPKASLKQPIDKILVAARCNIKNEIPNIQNLALSLNIDEQVFHKQGYGDQRWSDFGQILLRQKQEVLDSKDKLGETNDSLNGSSTKQQIKKNGDLIGGESFVFDNEVIPNSLRMGSPRKIYSRHIMQQKKYQQNLQKQKRQILELKKQLNKNYAKPFNPPQNITAQAYIIYQIDAKKIKYNRKFFMRKQQNQEIIETKRILLHSHKIMASLNPKQAVEIASLTKIMTCIVALEISNKYNIPMHCELVTIGIFEQNISGTSANIKKGQIYTVEQLLFGLMLPSGNDASLAIAVWGGRVLLERQNIERNVGNINVQTKTFQFSKRQSYDRFISEMNNKANQLSMEKTRFVNSHGLSNVDNKSCAFDLAVLCEHAMGNKKFRQIVSTKLYQCEIKLSDESSQSQKVCGKDMNESVKLLKKKSNLYDQQFVSQMQEMKNMNEMNQQFPEEQEENQCIDQVSDLTKTICWRNSHFLLQSKPELYIGIKTGITNTAGPCLASCIEFMNRKFIIIVLNSKSMKFRFKDTQNLRKWIFNKEQFKYFQKKIGQDQMN